MKGQFYFALAVGVAASALASSAQAQAPPVVTAAPVAAPPAYVAPKPGTGLQGAPGGKGLAALSYDGFSILPGENYGAVEPSNGSPKFVKADGTTYSGSDKYTATREGDSVLETYPWGTIRTDYGTTPGVDGKLTMRLTVKNTLRETLQYLNLRLLSLNFPAQPTAFQIDPGMWGNGGTAPLGSFPMNAGGTSAPGVLGISSPVGRLYFCADDSPKDTAVAVPFPVGPITFPFEASVPPIAAGATWKGEYSLRFGPPPGASEPFTFKPAREVLQAFGKKHPMALKWSDHRPISMLFLASNGLNDPEKNPRRWMVANGTNKKVDVTTPQGKAEFQQLVLRWADTSVQVAKDAHGQGMITWDVEGEQYGQATFYGKPHLIGKLAPEMEDKVEIEVMEKGKKKTLKLPLIDAYFRKFQDAGLRTGVCLRPQTVEFDLKGVPGQKDTNARQGYDNLREDVAYANKRWGCTLFYMDSTVEANGALSPWVFEKLHDEFPDILMLPENQTLRDYAVSAPLDSFYHHGVARTSPAVREVWPDAFTCLMAPDGAARPDAPATSKAYITNRASMVNGVHAGDVLLFNGWYMNDGIKDIVDIYREAGVDPKTGALSPLALESRTAKEQKPLPVNASTTPAPIDLAALLGQIDDAAKQGPFDVVFVGDSMTSGWAGAGKASWDKLATHFKMLNAGVPGSRTENVLWQLQNTGLKNLQPNNFVLMIGTNNLSANRSAEETVSGIEAVVRALRAQAPHAKIILMGVLPRPQNEGLAPTGAVKTINTSIAKLANAKNVLFIDIGDKFVDTQGNVDLKLLPDRLHPSPAGYDVWEKALEAQAGVQVILPSSDGGIRQGLAGPINNPSLKTTVVRMEKPGAVTRGVPGTRRRLLRDRVKLSPTDWMTWMLKKHSGDFHPPGRGNVRYRALSVHADPLSSRYERHIASSYHVHDALTHKVMREIVPDRCRQATWPREWNVEWKPRAPGNTIVAGVFRGGQIKSLNITPRRSEQEVIHPVSPLRADTE